MKICVSLNPLTIKNHTDMKATKELKALFQELVAITTEDIKNREWAIQRWIGQEPFNKFTAQELMAPEIEISNVTISRGNGYGQYIVSGLVNGEYIEVPTTDSEAFDWLNDDSNEEKHQEAIAHCNMKLEMAYERKLDNE